MDLKAFLRMIKAFLWFLMGEKHENSPKTPVSAAFSGYFRSILGYSGAETPVIRHNSSAISGVQNQ